MTSTPSEKGNGGRIIGLVAISIGALIGLLIALGGLAAIGAHAFLRDDDGYFTTSTERFSSPGYAVTSDDVDLGRESIGFDVGDLNTSVKFTGEGTGGGRVFLGIGPTSDVARYLAGVPHSELDDIHSQGPAYTQVGGRSSPRTPPGAQGFWAVESEGPGAQEVDFDLESGNWTVVAMNADAARGVSITGEAGAKLSWLLWVGVGLLVTGALIAGSCGYGVYRLSGGREGESSAEPPGRPEGPARD
jgi:hypothetical protein